MKYFVQGPDALDNIEIEISDRVEKGLTNLQELAFGLERTTTPSAGKLQCDNSDGFFERTEQTFFSEEITNYLLIVRDTRPDGVDIDVFVGLIDDLETWNQFLNARNLSVHDYVGMDDAAILQLVRQFRGEVKRLIG